AAPPRPVSPCAARRLEGAATEKLGGAELLGSGKTQLAVAEAIGVSDRTIRNWKQAPSFQRDLERARERLRRQAHEAWERFTAHNLPLLASMRGQARQPRSQLEPS